MSQTPAMNPNDVAPAVELGLRTVWINRLGEEAEPEPEIVPEPTVVAAPPEAAAQVTDDHSHLGRGQAKDFRDIAAHLEGMLRRRPDCHTLVVPMGDDRVRLHGVVVNHSGACSASA